MSSRSPLCGQAGWGVGGGDTSYGCSDWPAGLVGMIRPAAAMLAQHQPAGKTLALILFSITIYRGLIPEAQLLPALSDSVQKSICELFFIPVLRSSV